MAGPMSGMFLVLCVIVMAESAAVEKNRPKRIPFVPDPNQWFILKNRVTLKCVDVQGYPGTSNQDPIQSYTCELPGGSPATDQVWRRDEEGRIINMLTPDKCMDVKGYRPTENSVELQLYSCENPFDAETDQIWDFVYVGEYVQIVNRYTEKCLDVKGYQDPDNSVQIQQYTCEAEDDPQTDQWWTVDFYNPSN